MAESKDESEKEESEKAGLKLNIQTMIMAFGSVTLWQIDGEAM